MEREEAWQEATAADSVAESTEVESGVVGEAANPGSSGAKEEGGTGSGVEREEGRQGATAAEVVAESAGVDSRVAGGAASLGGSEEKEDERQVAIPAEENATLLG